MSNEAGGAMIDRRKSNWGKLIVMNAAVSAWLIYDIATASEAPSAILAIRQYVLLAGALIGLVGSVIKYLSRT